MTSSWRLDRGGTIDRSRPLRFRFDGIAYEGFAGDTLASALLANDVRLVGRSFKYHRPRGIFAAGAEEPNALVAVGEGGRRTPNTRATTLELYDGLTAESQNRWPSLAFDAMAIAGAMSRFIPAGFYYKTFMAPSWRLYEPWIRRAAGLGSATESADPDRYEKRQAHCDVLVVGGGPTGLAAALAAGRAGARTILVDEGCVWGGSLWRDPTVLEGQPSSAWIAAAVAELASLPRVHLGLRTAAFGYYDHNVIGMIEHVQDHLEAPSTRVPRQRFWIVRARDVVLATGAIERGFAFADNDRPGIMLAGAVRTYLNRFAVRPGGRALVATNNDDAYKTAIDLAGAGIEVAAIVDSRRDPAESLARRARSQGIPVLSEHVVIGASGRLRLDGISIAPADGHGPHRRLACDLLAISGGWSPAVHLHSQSGAKPVYDPNIAAFVPGPPRQRERTVGAARGTFALSAAMAEGAAAGAAAARSTGHGDGTPPPMPRAEADESYSLKPLWATHGGRGKRFVDLQDDVTVDDVELAHREGYVSVEHLKRYTTLGMGTDQGKTSNVIGHALMAEARGQPVAEVGTTTFRPPYAPVAFGAFAGREIHKHFSPVRRTPLDNWHRAHGGDMIESGAWMRPRAYPKSGETSVAAGLREAATVRGSVGIVDVSTLGKIDVQGRDAARFLDLVYCNTMSTLPIGRARYGLMLREDGIVFDDGTASRLSETRFHVTTTTANAGPVMTHLERLAATVVPEFDVHLTSVSDQWAAIAIAGPKSRDVLARCVRGTALDNESLPFMGVRDGRVGDIPVRLYRISFSGELAWEINAPADLGEALWEALLQAGRSEGIVAYGLEAMGVMRIEKGHVAGPELDGRTTPADLGLGRMVSKKKDFIGRRLLERPALADPKRPCLVGLVPADGRSKIRAGSQLIADTKTPPVPMLGVVTSMTMSPALGHYVALGLLAEGGRRRGDTLVAAFPLKDESVAVKVVDPVFYDPEGRRLHG
jgi:sarcosine oxidase subunit alpha